MDANDQMRLAARISDAEREKAKERYKETSRKRLQKNIETKIRTTFVGALSEVEQHMGEVWGHGLPEESCTEEQLRWRQVWDALRTRILNNGNNQLRAAQSEVSQYDVNWNRHQMVLPVKPAQV